MPSIHPGEIWLVDFGPEAKPRPALLLTGEPEDEELDLVTLLLHTTVVHGDRSEYKISKPFLAAGAFQLHVQTVSTLKLERRLGAIPDDELDHVWDALSGRLAH